MFKATRGHGDDTKLLLSTCSTEIIIVIAICMYLFTFTALK